MDGKLVSSVCTASFVTLASLSLIKRREERRRERSGQGVLKHSQDDGADTPMSSLSVPSARSAARSFATTSAGLSISSPLECNNEEKEHLAEPPVADIKPYDVTLFSWRLVKRRLVLAVSLFLALLMYRLEFIRLAVVTSIAAFVFDFAVDHTFVKHCLRVKHVELLEHLDATMIKSLLGELPAWIRFDDADKAEWLNIALRRIWPFLNRSLCELLTDRLKSILERRRLPGIGLFGSRCHMDFGSKAPIVTGVQVHDDSNTSVVFDIHVNWVTLESNIQLKAGNLTFSLADMAVKGILRIRLGPLLRTMPVVGAVGLSFVEPPTINFSVQAAGVDCKPFISQWMTYFLNEQLCRFVVLPEELNFPLSSGVPDRSHHPEGSLRVKLLKIKRLEGTWPWQTGTKVTSVTMRVGSQILTRNMNALHRDGCIYFVDPQENDILSFCVYAKHLQRLSVVMKDGYGLPLGEMNLAIADMEENVTKVVSEQLTQSATQHPTVDLSVLYRPLHPVGLRTGVGGGVVLVTLREATNLPALDVDECDAYFNFRIRNNPRDSGVKSTVQMKTLHPAWIPPEEFQLHAEEDDAVLLIEAYHCPNLSEDSLLATCRLTVPKEKVTSHWFTMNRERGVCGSSPLSLPSLRQTPRVRLDVEFLPY